MLVYNLLLQIFEVSKITTKDVLYLDKTNLCRMNKN